MKHVTSFLKHYRIIMIRNPHALTYPLLILYMLSVASYLYISDAALVIIERRLPYPVLCLDFLSSPMGI